MNKNLQTILDFINESQKLSDEDKSAVHDALKKADKDLMISKLS